MTVAPPTIIGGMFGLADRQSPRATKPPFLDGRTVLLANARSGIYVLLNHLRPAQVWMPSYLCESMLAPLQQSSHRRPEGAPPLRGTGGSPVSSTKEHGRAAHATARVMTTATAASSPSVHLRWYEIEDTLHPASDNWLDEVRPGDLVILIDYFGFPADERLAARAKSRGAWILEDACQALLSPHPEMAADFVLFSPRKTLGTPDGGVLRIRPGLNFPDIPLHAAPPGWWAKSLEAATLRQRFDEGRDDRSWFTLFREVEAKQPVGSFAMSDVTREFLHHAFDYETIGRRRRENYQTLLESLADIALLPELPDAVVPAGFPVRVERRDAVRQALFNHSIFPPVHWPLQGFVPAEFEASHALAGRIMTLPCDQRYGPAEMRLVASCVKEAMVS